MSTTTPLADASFSPSRSLVTTVIAAIVLAAFSVFSIWVTVTLGYTGFLALAAREPWALQMLLDLVIACSFVVGWLVRDARRNAITPWPFIVVTVFLGSIGPLAYLVYRGTRGQRARA